MRTLYSLAMYLAIPPVLAHFGWRGIRDRAYLRRWSERFGRFAPSGVTGGIAVHAASVGEVNAAAALLKALLHRLPHLPITLTTFTPTGSRRAVEMFGDRVFHVYSPLDLPGSVRRFFDKVRPRALLVMETEVWPNLFAAAARRNIPIVVANARLSERSVRGYRRWNRLAAAALQRVAFVAAQTPADAERFVSCGAVPTRVAVTGNLKFDLQIPDGLPEEGRELRSRWGLHRPVLVAGSTHEADDTVVIDAFRSVLQARPEALLVLVPRHPERFEGAARAARDADLRVGLHSRGLAGSDEIQCLVVDAMGALMPYYAASDVAFVGGSFARIGGHNVLEPAALGKPVLFGPHVFNFEDITREMTERGAALQVRSGAQLASRTAELFSDSADAARMGRAGLEMVKDGRGALERTLEVVERLLRD